MFEEKTQARTPCLPDFVRFGRDAFSPQWLTMRKIVIFAPFNSEQAMTQALILTLQNFFKDQPVEKAWVFGSFARGEEGPDSDVDILVQFDKNARLSLLGFIHIKNELEDTLGREVDLVEDGYLLPFAVESANHDKILVYERAN